MRTIPFGRPIIGPEEKQAVAEVLSGDILVHGPRATAFEADFCTYTKAAHSISVASCTAGMHLYYFHLGLKTGDEVIVPAQTHAATAHAVELTGASAVFVDAERKTGNIDISQIEEKITERTKAISVVHYLGMPVDMDKVNAIAKKHRLPVLEDCALAIGTKYNGVHAGRLGTCGVFSFYPVKHFTTAEGGMITTGDKDLAFLLSRKKAFGVDRTAGERKIPGVYDVTMLGFNYRMNEIEAVMGIEQLKKVDGFLKKRKENYTRLAKSFSEMPELELLQSSYGGFESSHYCMSIILKEKLKDKRFEVVSHLNKSGVGTSIYYPRPVAHMSYYREKYGHKETSFPEASRISYQSIALPVGPHLGVEDMDYIVEKVKSALSEAKQ